MIRPDFIQILKRRAIQTLEDAPFLTMRDDDTRVRHAETLLVLCTIHELLAGKTEEGKTNDR